MKRVFLVFLNTDIFIFVGSPFFRSPLILRWDFGVIMVRADAWFSLVNMHVDSDRWRILSSNRFIPHTREVFLTSQLCIIFFQEMDQLLNNGNSSILTSHQCSVMIDHFKRPTCWRFSLIFWKFRCIYRCAISQQFPDIEISI